MSELGVSSVMDPAGDGRQPVPFFTQTTSFERIWPDVLRHVGDVFASGVYSNGPKVAQLEEAIRAYTGARHAIGVSNGTDALVLLLRATGIGVGDEVVVPAFTFAASATSVALTGARPVFADIDPSTYALDPDSFAAAVTPSTRAVMPVHLFCQMADMAAIGRIARVYDLLVLEDSAEAIGMRWDGIHAGLLGAGGVLSFFPTKTLGALGDAGMVLTDDDELACVVRALRNHGRRPPGPDPATAVADLAGTAGLPPAVAALAGVAPLAEIAGGNAKMDDVQAAVLLAKLAGLDRDIARRAELAEAYTERLRDVGGVLRLPTVLHRGDRTNPVFYVYLIEVERREGLVDHLTAHGIGTEIYYPRPLHLQPCFAQLGYQAGEFPNAEAACRGAVGLPLYPDLSADDLDHTCRIIRSFYHGSRA